MAAFNIEAEQSKREKHRTYQREYMKKWRRRNPDNARKQSAAARAWQLRNPIRNARNQYRQGAARRGLPFDLSDVRFEQLVTSPCVYCGAAPDPINGVDRVDSDGGYVEANVVPCCGRCNVAKNDMTAAEFKAWVFRVAEHLRGIA